MMMMLLITHLKIRRIAIVEAAILILKLRLLLMKRAMVAFNNRIITLKTITYVMRFCRFSLKKHLRMLQLLIRMIPEAFSIEALRERIHKNIIRALWFNNHQF